MTDWSVNVSTEHMAAPQTLNKRMLSGSARILAH